MNQHGEPAMNQYGEPGANQYGQPPTAQYGEYGIVRPRRRHPLRTVTIVSASTLRLRSAGVPRARMRPWSMIATRRHS